MTIQDGRLVEDSADAILDVMIDELEAGFGDDLPPQQHAAARKLYSPVANRLAEAQEDAGLILSANQIRYSAERSLELLTALIGVSRRPPEKASGDVRFYRSDNASVDYSIPSGTKVSTESNVSSEEFETTESATLASGTSEVFVPVKAVQPGSDGNVGAFSVTQFVDSVTGVESVENTASIDNGKDEEADDELRARAQEELANGASATADALVSATTSIPDTRSVSIFINDTNEDNTGTGGLPDHSFELVVHGGTEQEIADAIMSTKAAGDTSWHGANGTSASATVTISNGQQFDVYFSRPAVQTVYVDVSITTDSSYEGDDFVMNNIVDYIGGVRTTGRNTDGTLDAGDDVVYNKVLSAAMSVDGVKDVTDLQVALSDPPSGTSNIAIARNETTDTDATLGDIVVNAQ